MSRSGYSDDYEHLELYRQAVERALQGKRGQALLRRIIEALDVMPEKRLVTGSFQQGGSCTLGAVAKREDIDVSKLEQMAQEDCLDRRTAGKAFDIAPSLAAEVMYLNDEWHGAETAEERWQRMRDWAKRNLRCPVLDGPEEAENDQ